jgi:hypothetical protein
MRFRGMRFRMAESVHIKDKPARLQLFVVTPNAILLQRGAFGCGLSMRKSDPDCQKEKTQGAKGFHRGRINTPILHPLLLTRIYASAARGSMQFGMLSHALGLENKTAVRNHLVIRLQPV